MASLPLLMLRAGARQAPRAGQSLIPRSGGMTWGPMQGILHSITDPSFRATVNDADVLKRIAKDGYDSPAIRKGNPPDYSPVTDEEITSYSGVKGKDATFRNARLVGTNKDAAHTIQVAKATGKDPNLTDPAILLQEILHKGLETHSVEKAFGRTGEQNEHPIKGEQVVPNSIPPEHSAHTVVLPLDHALQQQQLGQPGQVHPDYLKNIGLLAEDMFGANANHPISFSINSASHPHPDGKSAPIETDAFDFHLLPKEESVIQGSQ